MIISAGINNLKLTALIQDGYSCKSVSSFSKAKNHGASSELYPAETEMLLGTKTAIRTFHKTHARANLRQGARKDSIALNWDATRVNT